jgi:hypothetical protein
MASRGLGDVSEKDWSLMVKLLMMWDIKPGKETAYLEFITREFAPALGKMGLQPQNAWYTVVGNGPQILADGVAEDLETMTQILEGKEWHELQEKLAGYVINFKKKVVPYSGRFQL